MLDDLEFGAYYYQEISAPHGYLLDSTIHTVTLSEGGDNLSNLKSIKNSEPTGTLSVIKEDDITGNTIRTDNTYHHGDASIAGAVYTLYASERITNRAGTVTYFNANEQIANFTFDERGTATVRVLKSSSTKLRANGSTLTGIPLGRYHLEETTIPVGYKKDTNTYSYTFSYVNQNTPVIYRYGTVLNDVKREPFEIIKISSDTNDTAELIEGAEFTVILKKYVDYFGSFEEAMRHTDEYAYDEWCIMKTDIKGYAKSNRLAFGCYVVRETHIPSDTLIAVKDFEVTLTKDSETPTQSWKVENDLPFSAFFKLVKRDELSNKTVILSNATFELYKLNEEINEWEQVKCKVGKDYYTNWTTDEKGVAYTENKLHYGMYKLTEIKIPNGFNQLEHDIIFKVSASNETCEYDVDGDAWITVNITNAQPTGKLVINKKVEEIDKDSGYTYLAEDIDFSKIKFKLTASENILDYSDGSYYYKKDETVGIYSIGDDGILTVENLPMGKYHVQEIETLDGYVIDENIYTVEFIQTDTVTKVYEYTLNLENLMTTIEISKANINDELIENCTLELYKECYKENEESYLELVDTWTTDDATHIVKGLSVNGKYILREIQVADNYVLAKDIDFTVENSDYQKVKMIDKQVLISKENINKQKIVGATLVVTSKKTKNIVDKWVSTKEPHIVNNLVEGESYVLHEEICVDGYVKATDIEFTVTTDKETQKITMIDKIVEVDKVDILGNAIKGAKLQVIDKNYNIVDEWVSTGTPHKVNNLIENKDYILHEEICVEGYVRATNIEFRVTTNKETQRVEMVDKIVSMSKQDISGNVIEGAEMTVTDENGEIVDNWTSTQEPHHISNLEEGKKYVLHEIYAPDNFVIATDEEFEVSYDKETQEIILVDKVVEISKQDISGNEIEGATMIVTNTRTKNIVDKWVSTDTPHKVSGLIEGENYILHEEICVDNFVKATNIEFTVSTDTETQKIKMIDKIVEIRKVDIAGEEIEGATLQVINKQNEIIDEWVSTKEPHRVNNLVEGESYILHEEICIDGYVKATDIEFTVSTDKETQKIDMIDKIVSITKTDLTNGNEIEGAKLIITDENGNIVDEWVSTKEPHKVSNLEEGKIYTLKEITAPYGYEIAESITFEVSYDKETQIIEMKDAPKVIQTGNETNYHLILGLMLISLMGIITGVIILIRKKKNY